MLIFLVFCSVLGGVGSNVELSFSALFSAFFLVFVLYTSIIISHGVSLALMNTFSCVDACCILFSCLADTVSGVPFCGFLKTPLESSSFFLFLVQFLCIRSTLL